jgi:hypothetical protein
LNEISKSLEGITAGLHGDEEMLVYTEGKIHILYRDER